jgi:hypothetical protein
LIDVAVNAWKIAEWDPVCAAVCVLRTGEGEATSYVLGRVVNVTGP